MQAMAPHRLTRLTAAVVIGFLLLVCLGFTRVEPGRRPVVVASGPFRAAAKLRQEAADVLEVEKVLEAASPTMPAVPAHPPAAASGACKSELEHLRNKKLRLSKNIVYSKRCVKPAWSNTIDRDTVHNISEPLITNRTPVNLSSCTDTKPVPCEPLTLKVPHPYPKQPYDEFVFGVATSSTRLIDSIGSFAHWLSGTNVRLLGVVTDAKAGSTVDMSGLELLFSKHRINARFIPPLEEDYTISENHFAIIRELLQEATTKTKWIGLLDDDTFFPSLYQLSKTLEKHDHTVPAYLGALSEDFRAIKSFGYMAFGGAGVFLSMPLAEQLEPHIEECLANAWIPEGDTILRDCIYTHTHTKLSQVQGLYQQDMMMDAGGFFESGIRPVSLHHWKSWYHAPVDKMAAVVGICGDCFLQRWRFGEDTVFTNGYSVAVYRDGVKELDLTRMEGTWADPDKEFDFSLGPLRRKLDKLEKKSYTLAHVEVTTERAMRQVYVYRGEKRKDEPDEVFELLWEL